MLLSDVGILHGGLERGRVPTPPPLDCGVVPAVLYTADVVCPMSVPPVADGGVLTEGTRVAAVGVADALRADADREHHIDGVLLPGLVNATTQVEHADAHELAGSSPPDEWLAAVGAATDAWEDDRWARSARRGVQLVLRSGTTTTGDLVTRGDAVPASARAGLAGDSWVEIGEVDRREKDAVIRALEHTLTLPAGGRRVGIAARGCAGLDTEVIEALADLAERTGVPLHARVARSAAEVSAIRHGSGPLATAARARGLHFSWLDGGTGLSPVRYLDLFGWLTARTTLAHGVWVSDEDLGLLAERDVTMVCCPRSDALLAGGEAPLDRYARCGVRLALGTDSPAAVPDCDVLADAAAWADLARRQGLRSWPSPAGPVPVEDQALRLATCDGADAMGWGAHAGRLEVGRRADLVGVEVATTPARVAADVLAAGAGRQVLTVLGGVRAARRSSADRPWPAVDHDFAAEVGSPGEGER